MKLICGLQRPTTGTVRVLGQDPTTQRRSLCQRLGVVFGQKSSLWWDLSVADNIRAMRGVYGVARVHHERRRDELVEALSLGHVLNQPIRVLSLGERVKTELACALLHSPELILLDEPTIGLDLVSKHQLRDWLRHLAREESVAVLLTSHDIGDVTRTCDRIALLERGTVVLSGDVDEIRRQLDDDVRVTVRAGHEPLLDSDIATLTAFTHDPAARVSIDDDRSTATVIMPIALYGEVVQRIIAAGMADRGHLMEVSTASLEDVLVERFRQVVR